MSLEEIRSVLPADTALVEFFCTHDRSVVCVVTRDKLHICPVTVQSRIQKLLQFLQFQMSKFRLDPQYVATFSQPLLESTQAHLKNLYQELIAPIRHLLDCRRIVFVQHGLLHYVPFHALHDGESYLIDRFAISYAQCECLRTPDESGQCRWRFSNPRYTGRPDVSIRRKWIPASILPNAKLFSATMQPKTYYKPMGRGARQYW
jgi:hypothetical protein